MTFLVLTILSLMIVMKLKKRRRLAKKILPSTLYSLDTRPLDAMGRRITAYWGCIEVTACKTQANRFFCVQCKQCGQYAYGEYGTWAGNPNSAALARAALENFWKYEGLPPGNPQV